MKRIPAPIVTLSLMAAAMLIAAPALAQYGERRQVQPEIKREPLQAAGTVKQVARGVIHLATDEGEQWLIQVQARPQDVSFTGTADASFVKPGMWVRFTSQLTRRGDAKDPIASLEIYTPREGFGVGVQADAIGGGGGANELFAGPAEEKPQPEPKKGKPSEDTVYRIGGQVSKISRLGELTINAAGTSIKAKLADDAKVSIDVTDLSYLQAGDKIEIRGWYPMGRKGQAIAEQVTASASQSLTDTSKKKKPMPATDKPDGDADNAEKPAAEAESADKPGEGEKKPEEKAAS